MRKSFVFLALVVAVPLLISAIIGGRVMAHVFPRFSLDQIPRLDGKTALVTGPTFGGLGHVSALELARAGAHVILAGRSESKAAKTMEDIKAKVPNASMEFLQLDLSSLQSVTEASAKVIQSTKKLDILLLNAGVMASPFTLTVDGFEEQFATNHLGHFLFTHFLTDLLKASAPSRVAVVSSAGHMTPGLESYFTTPLGFSAPSDVNAESEASYGEMSAYGRSKLANVLFATELAARLNGTGVYVNSLHPGSIITNLDRHMRVDKFSNLLEALRRSLMQVILMDQVQGAVTQLYVCTSPDIETNKITGAYFGPQAWQLSPSFMVNPTNQKALWDLSLKLTEKWR